MHPHPHEPPVDFRLIEAETIALAYRRAPRGDAWAALVRAIEDALSDALHERLTQRFVDRRTSVLMRRLRDKEEIAAEIATRGATPDPDAIHRAREALAAELAAEHERSLSDLYDRMEVPGAYSPEAEPAGRRSLRLAALGLLSRLDEGQRAQALWDSASNMTEKMGALAVLVRLDRAGAALAGMEARFGDNRLVMDKFFSVQPMAAPPARARQAPPGAWMLLLPMNRTSRSSPTRLTAIA